jgi:hypothetical protein
VKWDYFTVQLFVQFSVMESPSSKTDPDGLRFTAAPNPFRDRILFSKGQSAKSIEFKIYDISGRMVQSFALSPMPSALCWSGTDQRGRKVPAGIYFIALNAGAETQVRKIVLIR